MQYSPLFTIDIKRTKNNMGVQKQLEDAKKFHGKFSTFLINNHY